MNIKDLIALGQYLHGERWQSPLSRDLRVNDRTMRHWAKGTQPIPHGVENEIYSLVANKRVGRTWSDNAEVIIRALM